MPRTKKKTQSKSRSRKSKKKDMYDLIPSKKVLIIIIGICIVTVLLILSIILGKKYLFISKEENNLDNAENTKSDVENGENNDGASTKEKDESSDAEDDETSQPILINSITNPTESMVVSGKIDIAGLVSGSLSPLSIKIYDDTSTLLGESSMTLSENDLESVYTWVKQLLVNTSPKTNTGYIKVYPQSEDENSQHSDMVSVTFQIQNVPNRIKLFSPLSYQLLSGSSVLFRGEMKDFFEATMAIRMKDEAGNVIFSDNITASADNYSKFAPFSKVVTYVSIPESSGITGSWEMYEISMADGSETILLTIPITLYE